MTISNVGGDCLAERRARLREANDVCGLDFVEVLGRAAPVLRLHFLGQRPTDLTPDRVRISRQGATCNLAIVGIQPSGDLFAGGLPACPHDCVDLKLDRWGDHREYQLELLDAAEPFEPEKQGPPAEPRMDPFFRRASFYFWPRHGDSHDCLPSELHAAADEQDPPISYLAKDYASFRQLLLDRLAVTLPGWNEHNPADVGLTLVELLAYEADHLSYYQDAVATEAYLHTCRLRKSLRRHSRLVDYRLHEGCNARAWLQVTVDRDEVQWDPRDLFFLALRRRPPEPIESWLMGETLSRWLDSDMAAQIEVFEPCLGGTIRLWKAHNRIELYDWLGAESCLHRGATSATLRGRLDATAVPDRHPQLRLQVGDALIFEELLDPFQGAAAGADPGHRHPVRISHIEPIADPLTGEPLVRIRWPPEDALPFVLWIRRRELGAVSISVARGNMLLVDHGRRASERIKFTPPRAIPAEHAAHYPRPRIECHLPRGPLSHHTPPAITSSAAAALVQDPRQAVPTLVLRERGAPHQPPLHPWELMEPAQLVGRIWSELPDATLAEAWRRAFPRATRVLARQRALLATATNAIPAMPAGLAALCRQALVDDARRLAWIPRYDLLASGPQDRHFVVETDEQGNAQLRFGDGQLGQVPAHPAQLTAEFRIGNGAAGNVPAEAIAYVGCYRGSATSGCRVRNPLPAVGGIDPESADDVRWLAPQAMRFDLQRAITTEDYELLVLRHFPSQVQRAKATRRWTGHEHEVLVAIDPWDAEQQPEELARRVAGLLGRYRRIGHEVRVRPARRVPLTLGMRVCVYPHLADQVRAALHELFSNRLLPNGQRAFFHADEVTFGDGLDVSRIVAAAANVAGVRHVTVTRLSPSDANDESALDDGVLWLGPLEIALLANDPLRPDLGRLQLVVEETP